MRPRPAPKAASGTAMNRGRITVLVKADIGTQPVVTASELTLKLITSVSAVESAGSARASYMMR